MLFDKMQCAGASLQIDNVKLRAALQESSNNSDKLEEGQSELQELRDEDQIEFRRYEKATEGRISELQLSAVLSQTAATPTPVDYPGSPDASGAQSVDSAQERDMNCVREQLRSFEESFQQIKDTMKLQSDHIEALKMM